MPTTLVQCLGSHPHLELRSRPPASRNTRSLVRLFCACADLTSARPAKHSESCCRIRFALCMCAGVFSYSSHGLELVSERFRVTDEMDYFRMAGGPEVL
jgi:hypothetical protein